MPVPGRAQRGMSKSAREHRAQASNKKYISTSARSINPSAEQEMGHHELDDQGVSVKSGGGGSVPVSARIPTLQHPSAHRHEHHAAQASQGWPSSHRPCPPSARATTAECLRRPKQRPKRPAARSQRLPHPSCPTRTHRSLIKHIAQWGSFCRKLIINTDVNCRST